MKILRTPTIRRMPTYLHKLFRMKMAGDVYVNCTELAAYIGVDSIVTRKDVALTGISGHRYYGYKIDELIDAILRYVGWDKELSATLIGCGALGSALLGYSDFKHYNLRIESVFDADPEKIGKEVHGYEIYDIADMEKKLPERLPKIAIICVPNVQSQAIADIVISLGIKYIWNFANTCLIVPEGVTVQREVIAGGFAVLASKIKAAESGTGTEEDVF